MPIIPRYSQLFASLSSLTSHFSTLKSPPILISSAEFILDGKTSDKQPAFQFEKGQLFKARVLDVLSPRQALLLIDGKKVQAKTFVPLKPGQEVQVRVSQSGDQPVLRLVQTAEGKLPEAFQGLLKSWGESGPFGHLDLLLSRRMMSAGNREGSLGTLVFSRLQQMVTAISLKSGDAEPRFLSDLIRGSGLLWENKLLSLLSSSGGMQMSGLAPLIENDIKGLALQLLAAEPGGGPVPDGLKAFLEGLENLQLFNKYADEESGRYLLPLPVLLDGKLTFGQMLLILGDGRNNSERGENRLVTVSFLLTLSRLGEIRADFSVLGRTVTGAFSVATEEIRAFISHHLGELGQKLQSNGYEVIDIGCRVVGLEVLAETALFDKAIEGAHNGVLNLVI
ncbi:MAG: hypothetical protein RBT11_06615 [Desulfobacterales bacterium]|jgi:hypothetical protein|nr:hypothetical protein [Desulfobacterales bacterium]